MESMVLPIPFSSFNVGVITLIFRQYHSQKQGINDMIKRFCKKTKEKEIREGFIPS